MCSICNGNFSNLDGFDNQDNVVNEDLVLNPFTRLLVLPLLVIIQWILSLLGCGGTDLVS